MKKIIGIYFCIKIALILLFALSGPAHSAQPAFTKTDDAVCTIYHHDGEFIYRQATLDDLDALISLHKEFDDEANNNLLIFPGKFHRILLAKKVKEQKIHVACNAQTREIISFVTFFIINDAIELAEILSQELRLLGEDMQIAHDYTGIIRSSHKEPPFTCEYGIDKPFELSSEDSIFCYYGGAFTVPFLRGKRLNSTLFQSVMISKLGKICKETSKNIVLTYGQVQASIKNTLPIRIFSQTLLSLLEKDNITLERYSCRAYKPIFEIDRDSLVLLEDNDANKGLGTALVYRREVD